MRRDNNSLPRICHRILTGLSSIHYRELCLQPATEMYPREEKDMDPLVLKRLWKVCSHFLSYENGLTWSFCIVALCCSRELSDICPVYVALRISANTKELVSSDAHGSRATIVLCAVVSYRYGWQWTCFLHGFPALLKVRDHRKHCTAILHPGKATIHFTENDPSPSHPWWCGIYKFQHLF